MRVAEEQGVEAWLERGGIGRIGLIGILLGVVSQCRRLISPLGAV